MAADTKGAGLRAGDPRPMSAAGMTTDRMVAVLVLGALGLLVASRTVFRGALGG